MPKDCTEVEPLLSSYALGALDMNERRDVERHIKDCAHCTETLADYNQVSERLLLAPPAFAPHPRLRSRLIAALRTEPTQAVAPARGSRRSFALLGVGIAMVAMLFLNIALFSRSMQLQEQINILAAQQQSDRSALALAHIPTAHRIAVSGDTANGTLLFDPNMNVAVLYISGLEALPSEEAYQAWLISPDGSRTSGGLLQPELDSEFAVLVIHSPEPLNEFIGFGMTIEPSGGSPGPTGPKVVGAEL